MKTVGSILRQRRLARGIRLEDVEKGTKIRARFLMAIENDDFRSLPSAAYAKGFVKNYSEFLGLSADEVMAFFRRQTSDPTKASLLPRGIEEPLNSSPLRLTPARFIAIVLVGLVALFLLYFGAQYRQLTQPPNLVVESPPNQKIVNQRRIDVTGETDTDATVTVNGVSVLVRGDGRFFDQVTLEPGVNNITIVATSRLGKTTSEVREVGYQP